MNILGSYTAFKSMIGNDAKLGHLKENGYLVVFRRIDNKGKLTLRGKGSELVGYRGNTIGHLVYDPIANTAITTRNCRVNEGNIIAQTRVKVAESHATQNVDTALSMELEEIRGFLSETMNLL
jgi:hypothetical protein